MSGRYRSIREVVLGPSEVKPTYVYSESTAASQWEQRNEKIKRLDALIDSIPEKILDIAALQDPQTKDLLIYSGNVEHAYASEHGYKVRVSIITNQTELNRYNAANKLISNLGVTKFEELLGDLRLSAKYPAIERDMPKPEFEKLKVKQQAYQAEKERRILSKVTGWGVWDDPGIGDGYYDDE